MRSRRILPTLLLSVALVAGGLLVAPPAAAAASPRPSVLDRTSHGRQTTITAIGRPTWKPVDLHLFSAEIGTAASNYAEFCDTSLTILPPPDHVRNPALCVGPGQPHHPPYNAEIGQGLSALGVHQDGPFGVAEFSAGEGVWLAWMNVPNPGTRGSSPDFRRGPIIANALFPMHVTGSATHNGAAYSTLADFTVPKLDGALDPPFDVDGHSHFPVFIVDNRDFAPPGDVTPEGRYSWTLDMVDQQQAGWRIQTTFVVGRPHRHG